MAPPFTGGDNSFGRNGRYDGIRQSGQMVGGGEDLRSQLLYGVALGALAAGLTWLCLLRRQTGLALGPRLRWICLLVIAASSLIDFHFHEYAILTVVVVFSSTQNLTKIQLESRSLRQSPRRLVVFICGTAVTLAMWASLQLADQRRAVLSEITSYSLLLEQGQFNENQTAHLRERFRLAPNASLRDIALATNRHILAKAAEWPASEVLLRKARSRLPKPEERVTALMQHGEELGFSRAVLNDLCVTYAELRDWSNSLRYAQRAIESAPWDLRNRQYLITYFQAIVDRMEQPPQSVKRFISVQEAAITELNPHVHGRNRVRLN